jgi:hypothetical protein
VNPPENVAVVRYTAADRIIIGAGERAGLSISAPLLKAVEWPTALRWRRLGHTFVLEQWFPDVVRGGWVEVPCVL